MSADKKNIELRLWAKLEADDAISKAPAVGQQIAAAFEKAFDGVGERIADRVFQELRAKLDQVNLLDSAAKYAKEIPGLPVDSLTKVPRIGEPAAQTSHGAKDPNPFGKGSEFGAGAYRGRRPGSVFDPLEQRYSRLEVGGSRLEDLFSTKRDRIFGLTNDNLDNTETTLRQINAYEEQRKRSKGVTPTMFGVTQERLNEADKTVSTLLTQNQDHQKSLKDSIDKLTQSLNKNSDELQTIRTKAASDPSSLTPAEQTRLGVFERMAADKAAKQTELTQLGQQEEKLLQDSTSIASTRAATPKTPWYRSTSKLGALGFGLDMVGQAANFASDFTLNRMRGQAGTAQVQGFGQRQMLEGDLEGMIATSRLGGVEAMEDRAAFSAYTDATGKVVQGVGKAGLGILGAVGAGAAAGAIGGSIVPGAGTLIGGVVGGLAAGALYQFAGQGVSTTLSGINDFMTIDAKKAEHMQAQVELQKLKDKEFMSVYMAGRNRSLNSYNASINLGSNQFEDFLYAGGRGGLLNYGASQGLAERQVTESLTKYAGGMGGVFDGKALLQSGAADYQIRQAMRLKSQGVSNIEDLGVAAFRGANLTGTPQQRIDDSLGIANDVAERLRRSGMDQAAVPQVINQISQQSQAPGMWDQAAYNAMAVAGRSENRSAPEITRMMNMQGSIMQSMNTGAGVEGLAKRRAISDIEREFKIDIKPEDELLFSLNTANQSDFERYVGKDKAAEAFQTYQQAQKSNLLDLTSNEFGGGEGGRRKAKAFLGSRYGDQTTSGARDAGELLERDRMPKYVAPPRSEDVPTQGQQQQMFEAKVDAAKVIAGFKTLDEVLPTLNQNFPVFVEHIERLSKSTSMPGGPGTDANVQTGQKPRSLRETQLPWETAAPKPAQRFTPRQ